MLPLHSFLLNKLRGVLIIAPKSLGFPESLKTTVKYKIFIYLISKVLEQCLGIDSC